MLAPKGTLKVTDFGLAAVISSKEEKMHAICGTKEYMATEMLQAKINRRIVDKSYGMHRLDQL